MAVYFAKADGIDAVKIGYTSRPQIWKRIANMQTGCPTKIRIIMYFLEANRKLETLLHRKFKKHRLHGEWFSYNEEIKWFVTTHRVLRRRARIALQEAEEREHAEENS